MICILHKINIYAVCELIAELCMRFDQDERCIHSDIVTSTQHTRHGTSELFCDKTFSSVEFPIK